MRRAPAGERVVFGVMAGGKRRADELVGADNAQVTRKATEPIASEPSVILHVDPDPDVVDAVKRNGGRLYVCRDSKALREVRAGFEEPRGVAMARYEDVSAFELYVSEELLWVGCIELQRARWSRNSIRAEIQPAIPTWAQ